MKHTFKMGLAVVAILVLLAGIGKAAIDEITNFSGVHISGSFGTATPELMVNQPSGGAGNPFEVRAANTPVFQVDSSGNLTYSGSAACQAPLYVNAGTAVATATPAMFVNSLAVSKLFEVRDASTPVFSVLNGGDVVGSGNVAAGAAYFAAPTAIATQTPALFVNNTGAGNVSFEVRKAATPVFAVNNDGSVTGKTLRYATAGQQLVCGSTTVTGSATVATGLTTCTYPLPGLGQDVNGDAAHVSATCSSGNIVLKAWDTALTPAANQTGAVVTWCAVGTP
jgi:hypothetical protein